MKHVRIPGAGDTQVRTFYSFLNLVTTEEIQPIGLEGVNPIMIRATWLYERPMDCSLAGSSVHGILQARILEWVAIISFSRGSSQPRDQTLVSCIAGRHFPSEPQGKLTGTLRAAKIKTSEIMEIHHGLAPSPPSLTAL